MVAAKDSVVPACFHTVRARVAGDRAQRLIAPVLMVLILAADAVTGMAVRAEGAPQSVGG